MKNTTQKLVLIVVLVLVAIFALAACDIESDFITVKYDDSHTIYEGDDIESIKSFLTVMYTDAQGESTQITEFTLSGTVVEGDCVLSVDYNGITQKITVHVSAPLELFKVTFYVEGDQYHQILTGGKQSISLPADPQKDGYTFVGWFLEDGETQQKLTVDTYKNEELTHDVKVTAKFSKEYAIDFVGGAGAVGETISLSKCEDSVFSLPQNAFEKNGYRFVGWSDGAATYQVGDAFTMPAHAVQFTAEWQKVFVITCVLDDETYKTQTVDAGEIISLPEVVAEFGCTFSGWCLDEKYIFPFTEGTVATQDVTFYGSITENPKFSVNFIVDGEVISSVESWGREAITAPQNVTKDSFEFEGWYLDEAYKTKYTDDYFKNIELTANVNVYSKWNVVDSGYAIVSSSYFDIVSSGLIMNNSSYMPSNVDTFDLRNKFTVSRGASWRAFTSPDCAQPTEITSRIASISNYGWNFVYVMVENQTTYENKVFKLSIYRCPAVAYNTLEDGTLEIASIVDYEDIRFPDSEIEKITSIGDNAFANCKSLRQLQHLPNLKRIGDNAFNGCKLLEQISLPQSITSIGVGAFKGCTNLKGVYIENVDNWCGINFEDIYANPIVYAGKLYINYQLTKCLVISENAESISDYAFYGCTSIENVSIPSSVTNIGLRVFNNCYNLTEIRVENGNEKYHSYGNCVIETETKILIIGSNSSVIPQNGSVTSIGACAFSGYEKLLNISIPSVVTTIGENAFEGCIGLENIEGYVDVAGAVARQANAEAYSIIITGGDAILEETFSGCTGLTNIVIPQSVRSIASGSFAGCSGLESITIPFVFEFGYIFGTNSYVGGIATEQYGFSTGKHCNLYYIPSTLKSVTVSGEIVEGAFYNCGNITGIIISDGVASIGNYAFYGCSSLTNIEIPSSVSSIGSYAFYGCSSLTSIEIPSSVPSIGYSALRGCSSLTSIEIPSSVTSIGEEAFSGCNSLTTVTLGENSQLTSIGNSAFFSCSSLTSIEIPSSVTSIGDCAFSSCSSLENITVARGNSIYHSGGNCLIETKTKTLIVGCKNSVIPTDGSVTSIGYSAFYGCSSLTSIEIPSSVTSIGNYSFYGCSRLTNIEIPSSVSSIGYGAFEDTRYYRDNDNWKNKVLYIGNVLIRAQTDIKTYSIAEGTTCIANSAFFSCSSLTSIEIPSSVTSIGYSAFYGCSSLTTVTLGENSQLTSIGDYAFFSCSSLRTVTLGENSQLNSIGNFAFRGCSSLTSIEIPSSVTSIGNYAFYGCSSLTTVTLGENSQLTSIGDSALYGCSSLTSIEIPSSVTSIGNSAFCGCSVLKAITFEDTSTWYRTMSSINMNDKTGGTTTSVTNASSNVELFTDTYYEYYWYKI